MNYQGMVRQTASHLACLQVGQLLFGFCTCLELRLQALFQPGPMVVVTIVALDVPAIVPTFTVQAALHQLYNGTAMQAVQS